mgnify:CR=1 FL=1
MNTNKLNQHLENKTNQDIKEMVSRVMDLLKQFDEETKKSSISDYYVDGEVFDMLTTEFSNQRPKPASITYMNEGKVCLNGKWLNQLFLSVFKDRFFDKILDNRTKDLLNKVELLD